MRIRKLVQIYERTPSFPVSPVLENSVAKIASRKRTQIPYLPLSVHFSAIRNCNLKCVMCDNRRMFTKSGGEFTFNKFRKMIDQIPSHTMRRITTEGLGEPLLNPDLPDMFLYAKKKGFITSMFTNATLINEKNAASLLKGLDEIAISVDGATKETFEKIRFGANFEHVMKNIKLLTDMKKQTRSPTLLKMSLTCNRLNYKEIPKLSALAPKLGIYHLEINMLRESFFWRDTGAYREKIHNELACSFSDVEKYLPKTANIRVTINPPGEGFPNCTWPFRGCYISDDGYVTPCCICLEPEAKNFGNIFQTPLSKIWNNQEYQKFRQAFISNKPPTICQNCKSAIT